METRDGKKIAMVAIFPSADKKRPHMVKTSQGGALGIIMPVEANEEKDGWLTSMAAVDARYARDRAAVIEAKATEVKAAEEVDEEEEDDTVCQDCYAPYADCECGEDSDEEDGDPTQDEQDQAEIDALREDEDEEEAETTRVEYDATPEPFMEEPVEAAEEEKPVVAPKPRRSRKKAA
jgi:hypothetical protein